ncbi:acetyl esterase/lipase [Kribbella aluminosa]|uniref:Acetyl esterase/lipase n=1 Tax=Kribbella aluminosa TaxID=416017 RepID=A0ABS4UWQ7_9ACTN|nr:alpha/beta hydrolase [Kribbella aluminosa]MBP2356061.1 acetyl esterase/lipase [Kribbella aluminosa]
MPIGYLWSVAVPAIAVMLALAPLRRTWALGQLSWRLGFQVNELPFLVALWVTAATAQAAVQGDLATVVGLVGASLAMSTIAGLAVVVRRSLRAGPVVVTALRDGLGEGWADDLGWLPRVSLPWAPIVLAPLSRWPRDVVRSRNLAYGDAGPQNLLDVYHRRDRGSSRPCLVHFHGGGYRRGRKSREARALILRLAAQGWVCVSANYRLSPRVGYPAPLVDAKRVIAWVRERAPEYGIDAGSIFVAGSSAGAHLAAMVALTPGSISLQPGFENADTTVAGAICLYGFYGSPEWIACVEDAPSAPVEEIRAAVPPFLIAHGDKDSFVPVDGARDFAARCRATSDAPVVYVELPGAQHTFDLYHSIRFESVVNGVEAFTAWVRSSADVA